VSNTDSFIEEVSEELQRDKLTALLRKYGWIAALLVIGLVGGAAFNEYRKAQATSQARAAGDAVLGALEAEDRARLDTIDAQGDLGALVTLLRAGDIAPGAQRDLALEQLQALSQSGDVDAIYRDIASLKLVILQGADVPASQRLERLETLVAPGAPFRVVALEQKAIILAQTGDRDGAIAVLKALLDDQETTSGLRQRATQMIVALGGDIDAA